MAAPARLGIESHVRDGTGTVRVRGELDMDAVDQLVEAVTAATTPGGTVELDLREVGFIDSAGVSAINRCQRQVLRRQAKIVVVCVDGSVVAKVLHWTGLAHVMDVRGGPLA